MHKIALFCEDFGHEAFICALSKRLAAEYGIDISIQVFSASGGHGRVLSALRRFIVAWGRGILDQPELLIVATDANCQGWPRHKHAVEEIVQQYSILILCAIPDPHIERWFLLDSAAFKQVFGRGCLAPDMKCQRDRYKDLLLQAIRETGVNPPLGGIEYAEDLVGALNLEWIRTSCGDHAFKDFMSVLSHKFREWQRWESE